MAEVEQDGYALRPRQERNKAQNASKSGNGSKAIAGSDTSEPASEPQLRRLNRSATLKAVHHDDMPDPGASVNPYSMQSLPITELAKLPWISKMPIETDDDNCPVLDHLPPQFEMALVAEYWKFHHGVKNGTLIIDPKKNQLQQVLAEKFLQLAAAESDGKFDKSQPAPLNKIKSFLDKNFKLQLETAPKSTSNGPSSASSRASAGDFRDTLVQVAAHRSLQNYKVITSIKLGKTEITDADRKIFENTLLAATKRELVSQTKGQRTDVTATFQRDFGKSTYEYQSDDGSVHPFKSIDEFVAFVGGTKGKELPKIVSHYACQNLGIFIKNVLFSKTDSQGHSQSVLRMYDGTPVSISATPKASYRIKKAADGTITLSYRSKIDTDSAENSGKNTAQLLLPIEGKTPGKVDLNTKGVRIENATATVNLEIKFSPDGKTEIGTLQFSAEGWNHFSE